MHAGLTSWMKILYIRFTDIIDLYFTHYPVCKLAAGFVSEVPWHFDLLIHLSDTELFGGRCMDDSYRKKCRLCIAGFT